MGESKWQLEEMEVIVQRGRIKNCDVLHLRFVESCCVVGSKHTRCVERVSLEAGIVVNHINNPWHVFVAIVVQDDTVV